MNRKRANRTMKKAYRDLKNRPEITESTKINVSIELLGYGRKNVNCYFSRSYEGRYRGGFLIDQDWSLE